MARQLNTIGQIIPTELHQEMERSYLEYAMSVIVGRALPDVRDGLKPVHRRILYAMYELGLTPDRPFRKCARVVGDVLGKYHPHGDQSVYDALVRLVQDFSSRYPLLAGHGNFGSVDNDPPAAMRYTETRLAPIAMEAMLGDIGEAIVDFTDNFDSSQQEPTVVPAQLPLLLLNGCSGIAVGMATSIPPHNLNEIIDGLIGLINKPDLSDGELFNLIPGPDFPTGGEILDSDGILQAYQTGRGLIPVRGVSHLEVIKGEKKRSHNRTAIIVTELPFQVNKAAWIEKIASLVNDGKLEGISDLRDESDRTGMRVVIELKRDATPEEILKKLYRMTPLQSNFGVIFLALVNNRPVQLSLRGILEEFLQFRETTLMRQYDHELGEANRRLELLQGLLIGLENLDALIEILRFAPDGTTAKIQLQERLGISPNQGDAILGMPMRRITGLEQEKLQQEHQTLADRIQELQTLLGDRHQRLKALKKELRSLKKKFGDQRRTRILQGMPKTIIPIQVDPDPLTSNPVESAVIVDINPIVETPTSAETSLQDSENIINLNPNETLSNSELSLDQDIVHQTENPSLPLTFSPEITETSKPITSTTLTPPSEPITITADETLSIPSDQPKSPSPKPTPRKNPLTLFTPQTPPENAWLSVTINGEIAWHEGTLTSETRIEPIQQQFPINQQETLIVITDQGKAYGLPVQDIPPLELTRIPLLDLLPKSAQRDGEKIIFQGFLPLENDLADLLLLTKEGRIKRLASTELNDLGNRGLSLIKLRDGDCLQLTHWVTDQQTAQNLVIATSNGRLLRFPFNEQILPRSGRSSQGQPALRLRPTENLIGLLTLSSTDSVCLLTQLGYGKRLSLNTVRLGNFGDLGTTVMQFTDKQDHLLLMLPVTNFPILALSNQQKSYFIQSLQFQDWGKDGTGDLLVELPPQEWLNIFI